MNKKDIIPFLECYERHPCLWNPREQDYRNNSIRVAALKSIIQEMRLTMTVEELKLKIKNLRTTYNREISKLVNSKKSGKTVYLYRPQLIWFSVADRFLRPVIEGRNSKDNMEPVQNDVEPTKDIEVKVEPITIEEPFDEPDQEIQEDSRIISKHSNNTLATRPKTTVTNHRAIRTPNSRIANRRKRPHESVYTTLHRLEDTVSKIVNSTQNNVQLKQEDEFHIFALSVAAQLRQLPLHVAIATQSTIQSTLSEARLKSIFSETSSQPSMNVKMEDSSDD